MNEIEILCNGALVDGSIIEIQLPSIGHQQNESLDVPQFSWLCMSAMSTKAHLRII